MTRKTNQLRWLVTMLLLVAAMAMPKMVWAQVKYTVFDSSTGTLTFKYGEKPTGGGGITVYDIPDASSSPGWGSQRSSIKTVVFDESFKEVRPKKCYCWFQNCSSLTTINGIENLNTEEVTDMDYMFYNCSSLITLDLSGFNTAKVKYMTRMFSGCSKLTRIYVSDKFTTSAVTESDNMFTYCYSLVGAIKYDSSKTDANYANTTNGYFSIKGSETKPKGAYVVYTDADNTMTFKYGEIPTEGKGITVYDIPDASYSPDWKLQAPSIKTVVFDESFKDIRPTTCYCWFQNCTSLTTINGIENLNTEDVTDMRYMFYNCSSLTALDLSGFNTAKVDNMTMMFGNCSKLTRIYVSDQFTTSAVTSSGSMFSGCNSLVGAIKYDSSKTDANYANTTDGYFSIKGSETKPKGAYVVYTDADNTLTFKYGEIPTNGDGITVYDIPDVSSSPGWYSQRSSITTVVFDESFKDVRPKKCYCWFQSCSSLTTINGIENLNTEDVTDMRYMFYNCSSLITLDLSGFNTAKVNNMTMMFFGCSKLTTIYASSNFTTSVVTSSSDMFSGCTSLVGAVAYSSDKTNADYANTTNGYFSIKGSETKPKVAYVVYTDADNTLTFKYGEKPTSGEGIKVYDIHDAARYPDWNSLSFKTVVFDESFKDVRPKYCFCWFDGCSSLTTIIGIENLNTEEVTDMPNMFKNCSSLTTLDLTGFNTAKVDNMKMMFFGCSKLTTIYVSDQFTTSAVTSSDYMFTSCNSLVGTRPFDSNINSSSTAHLLDKRCANYHNGYFTFGIKTRDDLAMFANKVNGTYTPAEGETATPYTAICAGLLADLTLTDTDVLPAIGSSGYSGTFDGCGHTISGLNFSSTSSALFAQNSGTIKNLGIVEATIAEGASGSLCQTNSGTIDHCFFMGTTTGSSQNAGGICQTNNGTIANCYYLADSETDAIEGTTYKTTAQFASGEVCYLLNDGKTDGTQRWYQKLKPETGDKHPVQTSNGSNTVYYATLLCGGEKNMGNTYANTQEVIIEHVLGDEVSFNTDKAIYQKICQREGCGTTCYFADSKGLYAATDDGTGTFTIGSYVLTDATPYDNRAVFTVNDFAYARTFEDTGWTTWYVPFDLKLTEELCNSYSFSRINNVHRYDDDEDGTPDRTEVEAFSQLPDVTLKANYPYLVRAKETSDCDMKLLLNSVRPAQAEENTCFCQSIDYKYSFTGTYSGLSEVGTGSEEPYSLQSNGEWTHQAEISPMRHYLTISSRTAEPQSSFARICLVVIGDETPTGVVIPYSNEKRQAETYDLSGRLTDSNQRGIVIKNGKKIINNKD